MIKYIDIELLTALFQAKEPTSTAELARIVGCPRTTASDYMLSFAKKGFVKDVGGKINLRKWVMTEEAREVVNSAEEDEIYRTLVELEKEGKIRKHVVDGVELWGSAKQLLKPEACAAADDD